jgi:hypothetical protein
MISNSQDAEACFDGAPEGGRPSLFNISPKDFAFSPPILWSSKVGPWAVNDSTSSPETHWHWLYGVALSPITRATGNRRPKSHV